eukprot:g7874.t1
MVMMDDDGGGATVVGAVMDDMEDIDLHSLDDETQRFILETHLENIGFMDFLGFELASLSSQHSGFNSLPNVSDRRGAGGMGNGSAFVTTMKSFVGMGILSLAGSLLGAKRLSVTTCGNPTHFVALNSMWWLLALGVLAETRDVPQHSAPLDACDTCESEGNLLLQSQATEVRRGRGSMELELKAMAGQKIWDWKDKPMMLPGYTMDMNGRSCSLCGTPDASELWGDYKQRTDCGNHSIQEHPDIIFKPLKDFVHGDNNAWCELNDAVYNKNYMIQAKQVNTTGSPALLYDATYCYHNGWLGAEYRALQFDFDAMKAKADKFCEQRLKLTKNMTLAET